MPTRREPAEEVERKYGLKPGTLRSMPDAPVESPGYSIDVPPELIQTPKRKRVWSRFVPREDNEPS